MEPGEDRVYGAPVVYSRVGEGESTRSEQSMTDDLVQRYIDDSEGQAEARIKGRGIRVWALVGYVRGANGDIHDVATGFGLPDDAVRAAIAYYKLHKAIIDARREMNVA